jgi:hypothetical protein
MTQMQSVGTLNWRKKFFRSVWESQIPTQEKLHLTSNTFKGKQAFIVAGAPSLNVVNLDALKPALDESFVICIKQSATKVGSSCDAMVMNFCNLSEYTWDTVACPVLWTIFDKKQPGEIKRRKAKNNAVFTVINNSTNDAEGFAKSVSGMSDWGRMLQLASGEVSWGPGLMYELAIPLALSVDVSKISLVAWDIGVLAPAEEGAFHNLHFYENEKVELKTKITRLEINVVRDSTEPLRAWLASRGVTLEIISPTSLASPTIPRNNQWLLA